MAPLVAVASVMRFPAVGYPVLAATLPDPATVDPYVVATFVAPVAGSPDVAMARRRDFDYARRGRGDLDLDAGGTDWGGINDAGGQ